MKNVLKDYPIGAIVIYDNVELKIVAQQGNRPSCAGCYFNYERYRLYNKGKRISCCVHKLACTRHMRKDKRHVFYQVIENKL